MSARTLRILKLIGMSSVITMGGECAIGDVGDTLRLVYEIVNVWT